MIAADLIAEIQRLLAEGKLSQRKIAKLTGVSRGTVSHSPTASECCAAGNRLLGVRPGGPIWPAAALPRLRRVGLPALPPLPHPRFLAAPSVGRLPNRPQGPLQLDLQEEHAARLRRLNARRRRYAKIAASTPRCTRTAGGHQSS